MGCGYDVRCSCGLKGQYTYGGGWRSRAISGYCTSCRRFVTVSDRNVRQVSPGLITATAPPLEPVCPDCGQRFTPLDKQLDRCPRCGGTDLQCRALRWD